MKDELEHLPNIGLVSVARSEVDLGHVWDIEFSGCALKESQDVRNDGDDNWQSVLLCAQPMAITRSSTSFEILNCLQRYLSNIDSINTVQVNDIQHGWAVTFLSEVGDLPLMEVTKGRLTGPQDFDLTVSEYIKGDVASLVFDGSDRPTEKVFTVTNLISGGHCKSWRPVVLLSISTRQCSYKTLDLSKSYY